MSRLSRLNLHPPAVVVRVAALRLVVHLQVAVLVLVPVAEVKVAAQFLRLPEARLLSHLPVVQQRRAGDAAEHLLLWSSLTNRSAMVSGDSAREPVVMIR